MSSPVIIPAPPSKSLSHRALITAAMARGTSRLYNILESNDIARTREALTTIGASIHAGAPGEYTVIGTSGTALAPSHEIQQCFVGESGTTCRFMLAILAAGKGNFRIYGSGRMHQRPVSPLVDALRKLGAEITYEEKEGCPPLAVRANGLLQDGWSPGPLDIRAENSSQYLSALLLAAPLANGIYLRLTGERVASWPYIALTLDTMSTFGINFQVETLEPSGQWQPARWRGIRNPRPDHIRFHVKPGPYRATTHRVEGDWSSASYFLAAGALGPKPVTVTGLKHDSLQADAALLPILRQMGARVVPTSEGVTVYPSPLRGIEVSVGQNPDLAPTIALMAVHAFGPTTMRDICGLKIKESDRLEAIATELGKAGARIEQKPDSIRIFPPEADSLQAHSDTLFSVHGDHRLAMSLPLLGLPDQRNSGGFAVRLDTPESVNKSFPRFWEHWESLLA